MGRFLIWITYAIATVGFGAFLSFSGDPVDWKERTAMIFAAGWVLLAHWFFKRKDAS